MHIQLARLESKVQYTSNGSDVPRVASPRFAGLVTSYDATSFLESCSRLELLDEIRALEAKNVREKRWIFSCIVAALTLWVVMLATLLVVHDELYSQTAGPNPPRSHSNQRFLANNFPNYDS